MSSKPSGYQRRIKKKMKKSPKKVLFSFVNSYHYNKNNYLMKKKDLIWRNCN